MDNTARPESCGHARELGLLARLVALQRRLYEKTRRRDRRQRPTALPVLGRRRVLGAHALIGVLRAAGSSSIARRADIFRFSTH